MGLKTKTLKRREHDLSDPVEQLRLLSNGIFSQDGLPLFLDKLKDQGSYPLKPTGVDIFQVNVGYMCNQVCKHCHVDAGPDRKEIMTKDTIDQCLNALEVSGAQTLDLTGGAPEMNPDFRYFD